MPKGDTFPLLRAYPFGKRKGLSQQIATIRNAPINWPRTYPREYTSSVRRGMIIRLFRAHGILNEFMRLEWLPHATTKDEQQEMKSREAILELYEKHSGWTYKP